MSDAGMMTRGQLYTMANEGKRRQSYDDATGESIGADGLGVTSKRPLKGTLSIGVGHTGHDFKAGDIWTELQIMAAFGQDYHTAASEAYGLFHNNNWKLMGEVRQAVIADMCFQMGGEGVSEFRHMLAAIVRQDWISAVREIMASDYATEAPTRALRNSIMLRDGDWQ